MIFDEIRKGELDGWWRFLSDTLTWREDDTVLDIGCGPGSLTKVIADRAKVKSITGYDISPEFVDIAKKENYIEGVTHYDVVDSESTSSLKQEWKCAFSKAICIAMFHYVREKKSFFRNVCWCLKPGGVLLLRFQHGNMLSTVDKLRIDMSNHPKWQNKVEGYKFTGESLYKGTLDDLQQLVMDCGFTEVKCQDQEFFHYPAMSEEQHRGYIASILGHLEHLDEDQHQAFLDDAFQRFTEIAPRNEDGKLMWHMPNIIVVAKK